MNFYNHISYLTTNIPNLIRDLSNYLNVGYIEIIHLPEDEIVIAITVIGNENEVFLTTETNGNSEVYSYDTSLEVKLEEFLKAEKRDFKINQILNSKTK